MFAELYRDELDLLLLPLHHAVQVAENLATVDIISNGRLDVGLGQGYAEHEFTGYGIPRTQRLSRFLKGLDVLDGLWANEVFSYEDARREAGFSVDTAKVLQLHWVHVGASDDEAWAEAGDAFHHLLTVYWQWGKAAADIEGLAFPVPEVPSVEELRLGGTPTIFRPVIGRPEHVASLLADSLRTTLITHLAFGVLPGMDPKQTEASMRRLIRDVVPTLRS